MIIDCHYHLEEKLLTMDEMLRSMDACGIDRVALMAVMNDPFAEAPVPAVKLLNFLLSRRLTKNIARGFVGNFTPDGDIRIGGKVCSIYQHPDNNGVFDAVRRYPDRFYGWAFIRPNSETDPVAELKRWMTHPGFVGAKAHPFWHRYPPEMLLPAAKILADAGKPLIIHAGYDDHGDFLTLADKVPGLRLILAHAGFPGFRSTWESIRGRPGIYVDLSQTSYLSEGMTRQAVEYLGVERCLYGTDGPYGFHGKDGKFDFSYIKRRIERLFGSDEIRKRLLGYNFSELAGLPL